jgi:hypothetical protein
MSDAKAPDPSEPGAPGSSVAPKAAPSADSAGGTTFYRYHDARGRIVIVDSLSRVPSSARGSMETVVLAPPPGPIAGLPALSLESLHWPSFAAGACSLLFVGVVWLGLRRVGGRLLRFSLLGGLVVLGAGAYFGWVRRVAGQNGAAVSSPAALIEDARGAVEKMNERMREQQRVLEELESQR